MECKVCKGSGKELLTIEEIKGNQKTVSQMKVDCYWCNGTGNMMARDLKAYKNHQNLWCRCEEPGDNIFYDDGEHRRLHKHHYRCSKCKKVTQIG